jgi:hypothetical protein
LRRKKNSSTATITTMAPMVIQKPSRFFSSGMTSKFIPKMPVISVSGMNSAVITVSVRMISLVRWAMAAKWICTADSIDDSSRRA